VQLVVDVANGFSVPIPSRRLLVAPLLVRGIEGYPVCGCQYRGVYRHRHRWRATVKFTWRDVRFTPGAAALKECGTIPDVLRQAVAAQREAVNAARSTCARRGG